MGDTTGIAALMRSLRDLCDDIATLLGTADKMMAEAGWGPAQSNTAIAGTSASVQWPRLWFPSEIFRFYVNARSPELLVYIAVLLDDLERKGAPVTEPLITAGMFDYGPGKPISAWQYWYSRWHLYMPGSANDGRPLTAPATLPAGASEKEKYPFTSVTTFGVALASIGDTQALRSKVIEPLMTLLTSPPRSIR